jgi:hypothetical protein
MTSTDIGIIEESNAAIGTSLSLLVLDLLMLILRGRQLAHNAINKGQF